MDIYKFINKSKSKNPCKCLDCMDLEYRINKAYRYTAFNQLYLMLIGRLQHIKLDTETKEILDAFIEAYRTMNYDLFPPDIINILPHDAWNEFIENG